MPVDFSGRIDAWWDRHPHSRKVFVIGTGRSGTHLVARTIDSHAMVRSTIETSWIFRRVGAIARDPAKRDRLLPGLLRRYRLEHARSVPRHYLDKSHPNIWLVEDLVDAFPNSRLVGVQREAYGTIASMMRHRHVSAWFDQWQSFPVPNPFLGISTEDVAGYARLPLAAKCAMRWRSHEQRLNDLRRTQADRLIVVKYEELVHEPDRVAGLLTEFLDLPTPLAEPAVTRQSVTRWRDDLSSDDVAAIDRVLNT